MKIIWGLFLMMLAGAFFFKKEQTPFRVGVTSGPHAQVMEYVKKEAEKEGFYFSIVEFSDFILPNIALHQGDISINSYQHQPFLDEQEKKRGYHFHVIGTSLFAPLGLYSLKYQTVEDIPSGATVAIPNDLTNKMRALKLLQEAQLLTLENEEITLSKIKLIEIEAPNLPKIMEDVDAAVVNADFAIVGKISPSLRLFKENMMESPYVNIIVSNGKHAEEEKKFLSFYHHPKTKAFIEETFKGFIIPAWS